MKLIKAPKGKYALVYESERYRQNVYCYECGLSHVPVFYGLLTGKEVKYCCE